MNGQVQKDVMDFLEKKSQKFALPDFRNAFETLKTKRTGLFINERMLNFPKQIVPPSFNSLRSDYESLPKQYQRIVYVHKLRIADSEPGSAVAENGDGEPAKKKKKMGKAQKKKLAQKALLSAEVIYDDVEDEALVRIEEGEAHFFDYPVHTEIESSSKFHTLVKDGKSFKPYRRVVIMDNKRNINGPLAQLAESRYRAGRAVARKCVAVHLWQLRLSLSYFRIH
ncbi:hypothetical protein ANCDUO_24392 [Ancylostoma duodenale]|uniref:Uncharacterized protein n=1 Tax=Ancylostoma duodenale TaxID=51022 RepID=A0A0C2C7E1_9BILA|nr:hypothetical protein ANCDUO_24392 [Ancylostoma duodenale]